MRTIGIGIFMFVLSTVGSTIAFGAYYLYLLPKWLALLILLGISAAVYRAGQRWREKQWWRDFIICLTLLCCAPALSLMVEVLGNSAWSWTWFIPWPNIYTSNAILAPHLPESFTIDRHDIARIVLADLCGWGWAAMWLRRVRKAMPMAP